jgi:outer membrane murein-binding lipoprotein Lpp
LPNFAGEVKGLKAQCNSLADAAQAEKFELLAAKQENDRLNDQIVQVQHYSIHSL